MSDGSRSVRAQWGWVVLMVLGEALMALSAGALGTLGGLARFCLGAALVAAGGMQLRAPLLAKIGEWLRDRPKGLWVRLAAWTSGVLVVAVVVWFAAPSAVAWGRFKATGCGHPVELRVATAPDDVDLYRGVAERYERETADALDCRTTNVFVYPAEAGWGGEHVGLRPDVLISLSPADLDLSSSYPILGEVKGVGWTPLVLGVPVTEARLLKDLDYGNATWRHLLRAVKDAGLGVVRPYPITSSVGRLATDALLSADDSRRLLGPAEAREAIRWAGRSGEVAGYPLTTAAGLLDAHRRRPGRATLIVTERALVRSNQLIREESRVALPHCGRDEAPAACVIAFYPGDTFRVTHSAVPVRWSPGSPQDQAARDFTDWLAGEPGRAALARAGLRTDGPVSDLLGHRTGARAGPHLAATRPEPDQKRLAEVRALHDKAERTSRVLFATDASGSMGADASPGVSRLDTAVRGVTGVVPLLGPDDVFGLWAFAGQDVRRVVAFGPPDAAVARERLAEIKPAGGTPLHRTVVEGVAALGPSTDRTTSALVVLTDGEDTAGGIGAAAMVEAVRDKGVRVFVVALDETDCAASALLALTEATNGACLDAQPASVDAVLIDLFQRLWG